MPPFADCGFRRVLLLVCAVATTGHAQTPTTTPLSLTLGGAARLAARQSAATQTAQLRAEQADVRALQRRADLLPTISGIAETNSRTFNTATLGLDIPLAPGSPPLFNPNGQVEGPVPTTDFRARVSQSLFDPAVYARLRLSRQQASALRSDAVQIGDQAAAQAALAYVRALRAQAVLEARAADSALAADLLRIARETLRAGTGVALDETRAAAQLVAIRTQLITARVEREKSLLELRRALNVPLDQSLTIADALDTGDITPQPVDAAISTAVAKRTDIAALDAQIATAKLSSRAIRAERYPSISAVTDNGFIGKDVSNLLSTWTWALRVNVPVFDGLRRETRLREQSVAERELALRRTDLVAQVALDVRLAFLDAAASREAVLAARERQQLAEQEVAQARERFAAGVSGNLDVTSALLGLTAARTQLVEALAARQLTRVSIARSQGALTSLR
jgi:outer membrane protein